MTREQAHIGARVRSLALVGEARAAAQERVILGWFLAHGCGDRGCGACPGDRHTPSEVAAAFPRWPVTSIRRALTNMTKREPPLLVHHREDRRMGPLGARESCWSLA